MNYRYRLAPAAARYLSRLEPRRRGQLTQLFREIADGPYSSKFKLLSGRRDRMRRARLGDLRILFDVDDAARLVDILDIGPRGDVYKRA